VSLWLVRVGKGWAGRGRNDIQRGETGLGLAGDDMRNGDEEMNWSAETRPKKSQKEIKG